MTQTSAARRPLSTAQEYLFLGYGLLAIMLLTLVTRRIGPIAVLPALLGGVGLQIRFRPAPVLVLVMVGIMLFWNEEFTTAGRLVRTGPRAFALSDMALSASLLGYILVHYRLLGLVDGLAPIDPRQKQRTGEFKTADMSSELGWLILSLPVFAMAGYVALRLLALVKPPIEIEASNWHGSVLIFSLVCGILIVRGLIGYVRWRQLTHDSALLYLQDTLWQETRREQRLTANFVSADGNRKAEL
jgi:hypothetical protein